MADKKTARRPSSVDEGMALMVSLLVMVALSAVGAAMLLLSQTESYASMNYRMMSQARYGAEAGAMKAVNYLMHSYQTPGTPGDAYASYNVDASPVTFNNAPVVLSADPTKPPNYQDPAKRAAFNAAVPGTLGAGQVVTYTGHAMLVSMRTILEYATNAPVVIQTWQITGTGSLGGTRPASVEVATVLERAVTSAHRFGVFTTGTGCASLRLGGGSGIDSYDSTNMTMVNGAPGTQQSGGSAGTNGSLTINGSVSYIYGALSTPRAGVGNCTAGAVTAIDGSAASVSGGLIQLPQPITYPAPAAPNPAPPTTSVNLSNSTCAALGLTAPKCTGPAGSLTLDASAAPLLLGNVTLGAGKTVHLKAGTYNVNSINISGNSTIVVDSGPIYLNVTGAGTTQPIALAGGSISNTTFDPRKIQITYGGTSGVTLGGGSSMAAVVYMPNAAVTMSGGSDFYGSIVASTLNDSGGTRLHYDRSLANGFMVAGNYTMSAFTWKKY